ncbi:hypothetical protein OSB04_010309 [Centaurea solstitialis]|uniref:Glutaredoxin domain-containing protein n=1 Tax=Centaurea solstitialis TaxID=347529 RepID=A0AA38WKI5_9ASTR|nr:hypothetical protein OSB04_010309 [Centaurea solstitialis]
MGCASSHLLNHDEDFTQIGSSALGHHIVSLTSTTYGLLTLDPSSSKTTASATAPSRVTLLSIFPKPVSEPKSEPQPEVINSWELMAGLDSTTESFRLYPQTSKSIPSRYTFVDKENTNPNQETPNLDHKKPIFVNPNQEIPNLDHKNPIFVNPNQEIPNLDHKNPTFVNPNQEIPSLDHKNTIFVNRNQESLNLDRKDPIFVKSVASKPVSLAEFEELCPPKGENMVVIYTTTLRGVRKTFEACNAVRTAMEGYGVFVCERDISMDRGFREELRELMKGKDSSELVPPRVFVKGRYVGGADDVLKTMEEGGFERLLDDLPKSKAGFVCDGCGGVRFLPCFSCNGSCKVVVVDRSGGERRKRVVVRCGNCNENGLVHCPICS